MAFYTGRDPMSQTSRQAKKKYFLVKQARKIAENFFSGDERKNCPHIGFIGLIQRKRACLIYRERTTCFSTNMIWTIAGHKKWSMTR